MWSSFADKYRGPQKISNETRSCEVEIKDLRFNKASDVKKM